jgi:GR25 family glycosyltransferase involved in LPS biosynthesis
MHYIKPYLDILNQNDYGIKQIVYNRNYAETVENYSIQGHVATTIPNIVLHVHPEPHDCKYINCHYWPHYSFRPSICLVEPILQLGKYNPDANFFEREYAHRWTNANYKTAFYDGITHRHIGRLTSEIGKVKNAYDLNEESQFGNHPYFKIVNLERRQDRKQNVEAQLNKESIRPSWVRAVDGLAIDPTYALKQLFRNNDFGSKRGVIGCALSHYQLWQHLVKDQVHDFYVIMEDDITLCEGFKEKLDHVLTSIKNSGSDLLFLGYHMFSSKREKVKNIYDIVSLQSTIHPLQQDLYIGGTFAYIIHKTGAEKLLAYSDIHGIQNGIDYYITTKYIFTMKKYNIVI